MITSRMTSKGQTTIPNAVRKALRLKPHDRLTYEIQRDQVVIQPLRGTILDHKGSVEPRGEPENFAAIRKEVARGVALTATRRG